MTSLIRNDREKTVPDDYRLDQLIALVGGNPLPIVISCETLVANDGKIFLVHSEQTTENANRIATCLKSRHASLKVELHKTQSAKPEAIRAVVKQIAENCVGSRIGLDITGGTKAMAVNSYRAFEPFVLQKGKQAWVTYISASDRSIVAEAISTNGMQSFELPIATDIRLTLPELLNLHSIAISRNPTQNPVLPETALMLCKLSGEPRKIHAWKDWLYSQLDKNGKLRDSDFRGKTLTLVKHPDLTPIFQTMSRELGVPASDKLNLTQDKFRNSPTEFASWLLGTWLEHAVLSVLKLNSDLNFDYVGQNLVTAKPEFEIDVLAIRGQKLFVFSCTTDGQNYVKQKLFEAATRARQLGGDEASVCLVCFSPDPARIRNELRQTLHNNNIDVLGRDDVANLPYSVSNWVKSQG